MIQFSLEFESMLEELFIGLLCRRYMSGNRKVRPLLEIRSYPLAHKLLASRRGFIDWLPIERTQERARLYFRDGRPFSDIASNRIEVIRRMVYIRNASAHGSDYAKSLFMTRCVEGKGLPTVEKTPSGYLRGKHGPGQSRLNYLMSDIVMTFNLLAT